MELAVVEMQRELKECLEQLLSETDLTTDSINKAVTKKQKETFPKFYELHHSIRHDDLFLIQSFYIDQGEDLTCPAKTIVIYAHNRDFQYSYQP